MAASSLILCLFSLLFTFTSSSSSSTGPPILTTVTIPVSPYPHHHHHHSRQHNSSSDKSEIFSHLASLSLSRAHHLKSPKTNFSSSSSLIKIPLFPRSYGGYSISLSFGTPPQTIGFIMDTGSDLVWFPCTSRYICFNCNFPNVDPTKIPTFIPKLSSSSKLLGCKNPKCAWVFGSQVQSKCRDCDPSTSNCTQTCPLYVIQYGLGSTSGLLLLENLDLPNKIVPNFLVGCSILSNRQPEGIAGFGRGSESLPSQLGAKKFSYCLVSRRFDDTPVSSDLVIDTGSGVKTPGLSYTPFQKSSGPPGSPFQTFYYVMLRKIIVGGKHVNTPYSFLVQGPDGNGGTIVDSGSTFTFMEGPVFKSVAREFEKQMSNIPVAAGVENRTGLRPCFNISGMESAAVPELIFQFKGGAKMALPVQNYFALVSEDVLCLTIVSDNAAGPAVRGGPAIILGNFQQQNFFIEYDVEKEKFGFKKQNCVRT